MSKRSGLVDEYFEKALLAIKDRSYDRAAELLVNVIKLKPDHAEAWVTRGNVVHAMGRFFDSLLHYDRALELNPKLHDGWCNRGIAFADLGLWASAQECFEKSLALMPALEPHMNWANMACHVMDLETAEREYRACLEIEPGNFDAHINLGITLLGQGRWKEGWPEYEWRHRNTPYQPRSQRNFPQWKGESLHGKSIVLWPEQGFGDEILFMRYAKAVKDFGAEVVMLEARPPLLRLAKWVSGVDVAVMYNDTLPTVPDFSCALMDVPMILGSSAPKWDGPYVSWKSERNFAGNVGLCWSSGQRPLQPETAATASMKSIYLEWLRKLVMPGVQLVSLQKEHDDERLMKELGILDPMPQVNDFADTAELINGLDLVISVDTAVAHLAGAMGKPVWNLVRFNAYWPWMMEVWDTAWYPSMKLLRQPTMGDWDTPIKFAIQELSRMVEKRSVA